MTAIEPVPFVDPPDEPIELPALASHVHGRRAAVPPWMRDRQEFRAPLIWVPRYGAHAIGFHLTRSPLYAARFLCPRALGGV